MHEYSPCSGALLSGDDGRGPGKTRCNGLNVAVLEDETTRFAAQLKRQSLHAVCSGAHDSLADFRRTRKADHIDIGGLDQSRSGFCAVFEKQIDSTGGKRRLVETEPSYQAMSSSGATPRTKRRTMFA